MGFVEVNPHRWLEFNFAKCHVLQVVTDHGHATAIAAIAIDHGRIASPACANSPQPASGIVLAHSDVGAANAVEVVFTKVHPVHETGGEVGVTCAVQTKRTGAVQVVARKDGGHADVVSLRVEHEDGNGIFRKAARSQIFSGCQRVTVEQCQVNFIV